MKVYFIQAGKDGPIKIGSSNSPERRLRDLQVGNAQKLRLIFFYDVYRDKRGRRSHNPYNNLNNLMLMHLSENDLHKIFQKHSIIGEWFEPTEEILSIIKQGPCARISDKKIKSIFITKKQKRKQRREEKRAAFLSRLTTSDANKLKNYKKKIAELKKKYVAHHPNIKNIRKKILDIEIVYENSRINNIQS